ncbi:phospholipase D-like domain-containing protein [Haloterrigena alkaliphila]|uniref:Phospholipase n=1 Tax=Haloterrigena alkaliphila TaxID=2816475 RepID=A0A8A2VDW6_9EURY|nr:phospholipase D-like domain-containing protein [Haloterrigena alkaliphila]QSW98572.1 phospholipase D-like domain-containing protein [Haloterrigena alkaliphila]
MNRRRAVLIALVAFGVLAGAALALGVSDDTATETAAAGYASTIARGGAPIETIGSCPARVPNAPAIPGTRGDTSRIEVTTPNESTGTRAPRIVELYPNPTIPDNVGEYLVLETPPETRLGDWTLTDGHTTAGLPNETVSGRVALSTAPTVTRGLTDAPVLELEGHLRLAADGDHLELRNGTTTVDTVSYDRAPTARRWYRSEGGANATVDPAAGSWHPRGATCLPVSTADAAAATAFVLPDAPELPLETIREADERLLLAGYTFTSTAVADELVAAADRGVDVAVLLESGPVGGTPRATDSVLERLAAAGVDVRVTGGDGARYRYHHAKYAVADDRVLVTSENWKPSGIGGASSRGWGVRLANASIAADLAAVFRADHGGWDTESGAAFRANASFVDGEGGDAISQTDPSSRAFSTEHEPATVPLESAELLLAPDNAEARVTTLLADADDEILVKQASIDRDAAVLEATIDAARRGVSVRILLDSTWYHEDENEALAADLEALAAEESLPLEVRLVAETDDFEKIHAKGVVIDREVAVVGSANWNENSFRNNREVLLALHGEAIASYYAAVFEDDWEGDDGPWSLTVGVVLTVIAALALAALVGRRYVRFGDVAEERQ